MERLFKLQAMIPLGKHSHSAMIPSPINKFQVWIKDMYLHTSIVNGEQSYHIASGTCEDDELVVLTQNELDKLSPEFLQYFEVLEHN